MMKSTISYRTAMITAVLVVTCLTSIATASRSEEFRVPCLEEQFISIPAKGGEPLAFAYWNGSEFIGDDPKLAVHYQGITRVQGHDGTPYFILTRNGNPKAGGDDFPGEILVVRMGSHPGSGEALGHDYCDSDDCQPQAGDVAVQSYHLNGIDFGPDVDWKHPGSGQLVGNLLFVPVEKTCEYDPSEGKCGTEVKRGAILVLDVNDPENITLKNQVEYYYGPSLPGQAAPEIDLPMIGTLAVTKQNDGYLFAGFGASYDSEKALTFYKLRDINDVTLDHVYVWNANNLWYWDDDQWKQDDKKWRCGRNCIAYTVNYQMMNFVRDLNGKLYLLGTDNDVAIPGTGADWAKLFRVDPDGNEFELTYIAEKHLYLSKPKDLGDLDAAAGLYVSPSGHLILYTADHQNNGPDLHGCSGDSRCNLLDMGEFASDYYHPPLFQAPQDQSASEGQPTQFNLGVFDDAAAYFPVWNESSWQLDVNWSDGTTSTLDLGLQDLQNPILHQHSFPDGPMTYTVAVTIIDECGSSASATFNIDVDNVPPTASIDSVEQPNPHFILPLVHTLNFSGSFTDPGWLDTHTSDWDFGDGTNDPGILTEENDPPDATGTTTAQYAYPEPGTYLVTLTVTDDDGGAGTDTTTVTVISAEDAIEIIADYINDLPSSAFRKKPVKRKAVLLNKLRAVNLSPNAQTSQGAINKLHHDIRAKADGSLNGSRKNDWIKDPQAQYDICWMIDDLIAYLQARQLSSPPNKAASAPQSSSAVNKNSPKKGPNKGKSKKTG